jgi:hypothetical protein
VIDEAAVPDWLEETIGKPEGQQVLYGLLAEEVVDSVEIAPEPLLEHEGHPELAGPRPARVRSP